MTDRALSPVVGTLLLVALVLSTAVVVAAASDALVADASARAAADTSNPAAGPVDAPGAPERPAAGLGSDPPPTAFSLSAAETGLAVTYERGPTLDVSALRLRIAVGGEPLAFQPPLPFFAARGSARVRPVRSTSPATARGRRARRGRSRWRGRTTPNSNTDAPSRFGSTGGRHRVRWRR